MVSRVPLTFSTLWYQWGLLTIVVVMCEGSKTGFRIFLSITKIRPGHFEVGGFTVVKSKNWPPLIFLKLKFSYINQGPWTWTFFDFTTVKPQTSKWPGWVLVIDRKILKPVLESSHNTTTMDRSPHWYHSLNNRVGMRPSNQNKIAHSTYFKLQKNIWTYMVEEEISVL